MKLVFTILSLLISSLCHSQSYLKPNEQIILSFQTTNNKQVFLVKDKANKYIYYRFGTKDRIEMQFPSTEKDSWSKFKYSYYFRGGGISNEGMDLNYVYFSNNGYQYVIYYTYFSREEKASIGIKVTDLKTKKETNIKGNFATRKGTLADFRDNKLLEIGEELFD
jgi:hypothetical protein